MTIITLTTDYGNKDYSVSSLKAKLISNIDNIRIVDISHDISPFNLSEAGYVLEGAFRDFPKGTIHILSVDSELTPENRHIAIMYEGCFFIGADNGVFSLIFRDKKPDQIVEINIHSNYNNNISADELFVKVASHIKRSGPLNVVGTEIEKIKEITNLRPVINKEINQILGSVIYIDNYGNVVTNITEKLFKEISKTRPFIINARNVKFSKVYKNYSDAIDFSLEKKDREEDGKKIAIFNNLGYLQLCIYRSNPQTVGSASTLFGLNYRDVVSVQF
ncbi:SAM-dependent chlorinase/fluorinase [Flavobacteriaceae bacterium]|nr:SAM-dependent chlorinase/fluorinase [Flavobacteriaceae bacterium]